MGAQSPDCVPGWGRGGEVGVAPTLADLRTGGKEVKIRISKARISLPLLWPRGRRGGGMGAPEHRCGSLRLQPRQGPRRAPGAERGVGSWASQCFWVKPLRKGPGAVSTPVQEAALTDLLPAGGAVQESEEGESPGCSPRGRGTLILKHELDIFYFFLMIHACETEQSRL